MVLFGLKVTAQIEVSLLTNGGFEHQTPFSGWSGINLQGNLWEGQGSCSAYQGNSYMWVGDSEQDSGRNDVAEGLYQSISIPQNALSCSLYFYVSINTLETSVTVDYDYLDVKLRNNSGQIVANLGRIGNTAGTYGIPGCQNWALASVAVPSNYFNMPLQLTFEFATDASEPTIFRLDSISLIATLPCEYTANIIIDTLKDANAASNIAVGFVSANSSNCGWEAVVKSGATWLSTESGAFGNDSLRISVLANTTAIARTGTIEIGDTIISITQPGVPCTYVYSQTNYTCTSSLANNYNNIANVTAPTGCNWLASVVEGGTWLSTTSQGSGNGTISITVQENPTTAQRTGKISVGGSLLTINQPGKPNTGLADLADSYGVSVYPNLVNSEFNIAVAKEHIGTTYSIYDALGQLVLIGNVTSESNVVNIEGIDSGIYYLKVGENSKAIKIVKQ